MRNNQNKHGPDIDIGVWYAALLRHSEAVSGDSDAGRTARAGPMDCGLKSSREDARTQRLSGILVPITIGSEVEARHPERDWPPGSSISQKRRRRRLRSTIVNRRTGESPPGIVDDLIFNNIDSITLWKPSVGGREVAGAQTTIWSEMERLWPEVREKVTKRLRDEETERQGEDKKRSKDAVKTQCIASQQSVSTTKKRKGVKTPGVS